MGFDNECILNIQSLAGEYFCPVCRLLVDPNEALQSQCTHLYCKPCLTYIVRTTRACPYDGYLVTEADSKPLMESNKALAETIGKIAVHCLYQKSGCTWQGGLSDSISHCSGCAFGNSAVVCNRCGIQIVHRQVQEHAQNCLGVQEPQVQQSEGSQTAVSASESAATGGQIQASTQAGTIMALAIPQVSTSQAVMAAAQDPSQQAGANPQGQAVSGITPTPEQWYQQQYYQQYPGYYPYQQYPYQQQAAAQTPQQHLQSQAPQITGQHQALAYVHPPVPSQLHVQTQAQLQPQPQAQGMVQPQLHPAVQATPTSQSQNPVMVTPQSQAHPLVPPHSQVPSQTYPPSQGHPPLQGQPYSQPQPSTQTYPNQSLVQHAQIPQYQQFPGQIQHQQPSVNSQLHAQSLLPHSQTNPVQTNQPLYPNVQSQTHHPPGDVLAGHQSFPQPQPNWQRQLGVSQSDMPMHHKGRTHPALQPAQAQNQYPQQPFHLRPPQSHAPMPSQQPPASGQLPSIPPSQQRPLHPHSHQPGVSVHQRPFMQPIQQPLQQQPLVGQTSGTVHNQMHQQGPFMHQQAAMLSQPHPQGPPHLVPQYPQSMQPHQPILPNHGLQSQSHQHWTVAVQGRPVQLGPTHPAASQGDVQRIKNQLPLPSEGQSGKQGDHIAGRGENENKARSTSDAAEKKSLTTENNIRPADEETEVEVETKGDRVDGCMKGIPVSEQISSTGLEPCTTKNDLRVSKQVVKEEAPGILPKSAEYPVLDGKETKDGPLVKRTAPQETDGSEEKIEKMYRDRRPPHILNQGRSQPPANYEPSTFRQRAAASSMLQAPPGTHHQMHIQGHLPTVLRPHGPEIFPGEALGPASAPSFGKGLGRYGPAHHISEGPYNQGHPPPSHASKISPNAINSPVPFGLRDERFKPLPDDLLNPISIDQARRQEFEEDLKHFPRPLHLDSNLVPKSGAYISSSRSFDRGLGMDVPPRPHGKYGLDFDAGATSRFSKSYNDLGERPFSHREEGKGSSETVHGRPGYLGPGPGFGRQHIDGPRSLIGEYHGISSRGYGYLHGGIGVRRLGMDDADGREPHRFGFPSHLHGGDLEGSGNFRMGKNFQSGLIGPDVASRHLRGGDHFGPYGVPGHLGLEDQVGFGGFPHRRIGEPGFRSRFSFPNDGGPFAGDMEPFENSRKRKPASMGWCRICKVDCETVEGLDLHSQTKEHQKRSMDIVVMIKQNANKYKSTSGDHASLKDASKMKNMNSEGHGGRN